MVKTVPIEKQSKKLRKAYHAARRGSWNGVDPATRRIESKKNYDRGAFKSALRGDEGLG